MNRQYWLMKSEPEAYSIDDLKKDKRTFWHGVRNYQARNFMRDTMQLGDMVLFYHSNASPSGVAGIATIVKTGHPDVTALDKKSDYYDPKSTKENPIWYLVDIGFVSKFENFVSLEEIKRTPGLENMMVIKKGARLSVQPVTKKEFEIISKLGM